MIELKMEEEKKWLIRRVLRCKHSQEYFTGDGWTKDLEAAQSFPDCLEAARTSARYGFSEIEMVLRLKGGTADLYCTEFA